MKLINLEDMKLKIKVKVLTDGCMPEIIEKGDWIDLRAAEDVHLNAPQAGTLKRKTVNGEETNHRDVTFDSKLIKLGVAMELPAGFEACVLPRSGTYKEFAVICRNSQGVIDNSYRGDNDEWRFPALAFCDTTIHKGDRICQFRIQLSQKATLWQKIKWLLSSGVELVEVKSLNNDNRGGFNSTGIK